MLRRLALAVTGLAIAGTGLLGTANASCTWNTGSCNGGNCYVNTGTCESNGTCEVNTGTCDSSCYVNAGTCSQIANIKLAGQIQDILDRLQHESHG